MTRLRRWSENLRRDGVYALRSFRRDPGFTVVVLLTLMLGLGVGTAIFSVFDAVLLRPLPFPDSTRLTLLFEKTHGTRRRSPSYLISLDWVGNPSCRRR
jgi:hypothetical protein